MTHLNFMLRRARLATTIVLAALVVLMSACAKDNEPLSRAFRMGFTAPYGVAPETLEYVYDKLAVESDIVNHHFDTGVPWIEAFSGEDLPAHIMGDWAFHRDRIKTPHKTYVSVTPINYSHDGLALYRGDKDNMALPSPWNQYRFNDEPVKAAYLNYCKRVIEFFQPDYFAMSIEANLLYKFRPESWSGYLELHEFIYGQLKSLYPDLPIFTTISGAPLLKGFLQENDHVIQRLAAMQLLESSDYYAISFYPPPMAYQMDWPVNTFENLFSLSSKPVIIAETACTAKPASIPTDGGFLVLAADPVKQKLFVDALLTASDRWNAEFVIWLTLRDYESLSGNHAGDYVRKDGGLYDELGNPRPALNSWREWFSKRIEE